MKKKYDQLAAPAKDTKATSERSLLTAAKKEVDRLSAQVRDYKAEISWLRRAPPTPAPKSVIGASGGKTTVLLGFFNYNECADVGVIGKEISMSAGMVQYHASKLTEEQLLAQEVRSSGEGLLETYTRDHSFCITEKGRAYVIEKGLSGH